MIKVANIYNSQCLKCDNLEKEMVKIGPITFCHKCFKEEFVDSGVYNTKTGEITTNSQEYQDWLESYKTYIDQKYEEES